MAHKKVYTKPVADFMIVEEDSLCDLTPNSWGEAKRGSIFHEDSGSTTVNGPFGGSGDPSSSAGIQTSGPF